MTAGFDKSRLTTWFGIEKYTDDQVNWVAQKSGILQPAGEVLRRFVKPDEVFEDDTSNLTTTVGLGRLTSLIIAGGGVAFSATSTSMIGVGDTATAAAIADTQLGSNSAAHSWYIPADSTPTRVTVTATNDTVQLVGTFNTSNSDFAWQEWGTVLVTTAAASATFAGTGTSPLLFNHKIASMGTKSGGSWVATAKLTFS
jgi:hypothetical protein